MGAQDLEGCISNHLALVPEVAEELRHNGGKFL